MSERDPLLEERQKTHGQWDVQARVALKLIANSRTSQLSGMDVREVACEGARQMICWKLSRIVAGDAFEPDHWRDIAGYAKLALEALESDSPRPTF